MDPLIEADSDTEDDPTKLLNQWLGELNSLKKGLDSGVKGKGALPARVQEMNLAEKKKKYRCSLINLDTSQDEELDAILGELTVLESQFDQEIVADKRRSVEAEEKRKAAEVSPVSPAESDRSSSNITDLGIHSNTHSRSSSGSDEIKQAQLRRQDAGSGAGRTESPDTDSAFCDNLSLLSSCSAASSNRTGQSIGVPSSVQQLSKEEQEAKIKAEKIKIAIEKIKEASVKKLFIKVFTSDGSAKSLLVDEKMTVSQVTRILAEKNHVSLDPKWALVELVPDLYVERVYEDHEHLVENCLLWKVDSKNTLWFIERPEKFDLFLRPEVYLLGTSSSQRDDQMEEHSRQELLEEYFASSGVGAPELEGSIWLKADNKKSWKKFYFVLRTSGLYYAPKGKKTSKDLVCLTTFDMNQVYYGVGWKNKYKAPTEFCFGIKHPQIQAKNPKYIKYLCVDTQRALHQWVTGVRIAKNGRNLFENYRGIVEEITHADIDILTSKRFSVNSTNGLRIPDSALDKSGGEGIQSPVRTPSSENKSLASALSSGIESDLSNAGSFKQDPCATEIAGRATAEEEVAGGGTAERISGLTPVSTLERSFKLRRSFSRSSRSSSSSGCLSDKSGGGELGFESDFPLGGTIKKRPAATPRLPLTNTTWGLVRESDQEDEVDGGGMTGGGVVGLGAGGTLLRKAVRNSLSRKPQENDYVSREVEMGFGAEIGGPLRRLMERPEEKLNEDPLSSAFERSLSSMSEEENLPLPPPPRIESMYSLDDVDQLPPPPPDVFYEAVGGDRALRSNHYHVSPVTSPSAHSRSIVADPCVPTVNGLPPPCPTNKLPTSPKPVAPSLATKKSTVPHKSSRRISFDDKVQMIDAPSSPVRNTPCFSLLGSHSLDIQQSANGLAGRFSPAPPSEKPRYSPATPPSEKAVTQFSPTPPVRTSPGRLNFGGGEEANTASLPRSFLTDLQKVMNKKWQVAEKCRTESTTTPHEVLGFRDEPIQSLGPPGLYSQNSAIGAWVLESQQYDPEDMVLLEDPTYSHYQPYSQILPQYQPYSPHQPAGAHYQHQEHQHHTAAGEVHFPFQFSPAAGNGSPYPSEVYGHVSRTSEQQSFHRLDGHRPVVLIEPEPNYVDPSMMRANKIKRPPPPPRRSENTQLTAGSF